MTQITPQLVRSGMHLPPSLKNPYDRVVLAGMKMMFSPEMRQQVAQILNGPGAIADKLATGVSDLMLLLYQHSNHTMPPQVIIPAAMEMMAHAVEFVEKSGQHVSPQDTGQAMTEMITTILKKFGVDPNKIVGIVESAKQGKVNLPQMSSALPGQQPMAAAPVPNNQQPNTANAAMGGGQ